MHSLTIVLCIVVQAVSARATVTIITNKQQWQNTVGAFTPITLADYPAFTTITDQYASLGITFTDGNDFIFPSSTVPDGQALVSVDGPGNLGTIHMAFSGPTYALAFEFLDHLVIELYDNGTATSLAIIIWPD